jgi:CDP-diacylglycerol--glycerol-3-phosphate 3-phosphatidyltransferase
MRLKKYSGIKTVAIATSFGFLTPIYRISPVLNIFKTMHPKENRLSFRFIAVNSITFYRLIASALLLYLIIERQYALFKWLLAVSFLTDTFDGFLARRFKVVSVLGARMDSMADDLTVLVGITGLYFLKPEFMVQNAIYFYILLALFLMLVALALIRYRRFTSFHTLSAKVAAVLQGSFLILVFFLSQPPMLLFYAAFAMTAIDLIEEIILVLMLPNWKVDIKGIYWAIKDKKKRHS